MVRLECIEKHQYNCEWVSQDLPFENAETMLEKHLARAHPVPGNIQTQVSFEARPVASGFKPVANFPPSQENSGGSDTFYVLLTGLPTACSGSAILNALKEAGCPGYICTAETESGKLSGEVVIKLTNEDDKNNVLNYDYKSLFNVDVFSKEVSASIFFKFARKTTKEPGSRNLYVRLKGMEWQTSEDQVRSFLSDCEIVKLIMTKTPTGRPTGEAFIELKTEADTELAKKHNKQYIGRRFVVVEEVFEEQFNMVDDEGMEPAPKRMMQQVFDWVEERLLLKNLPRDVTEEGIKNFFTNKGDCDIDGVETLDENSRTAVVICRGGEENIFRGLSCNNSTMNGNIITVERIRKS